MKDSNVKLRAHFNKLLEEVVSKRKERNELVDKKQSVIEELIVAAHKKEVGAIK